MRGMIFIAAALAAATAEPAPAVVITANQEAARGCKFLDQESASVGGFPLSIGRKKTLAKVRDKVVKLGGNLLISPGPRWPCPAPWSR